MTWLHNVQLHAHKHCIVLFKTLKKCHQLSWIKKTEKDAGVQNKNSAKGWYIKSTVYCPLLICMHTCMHINLNNSLTLSVSLSLSRDERNYHTISGPPDCPWQLCMVARHLWEGSGAGFGYKFNGWQGWSPGVVLVGGEPNMAQWIVWGKHNLGLGLRLHLW